MNHADIRKHLADYLEGELPIDERALVDAHLDACDSCAGDVEKMLQTIRLLRTLPEPEIPPMIVANVMRRIRAGESRPGFFGRLGRAWGVVFEPGFVLPASAVAAAALVVAVAQGFGGVPISDLAPDSLGPRELSPREEEQASIGRASSSRASLSPALASTRRSEQRARASRVHLQGASGSSNAMAFVARVERRATQSDRRLGARRGPRIRIEFKGLGGAPGSESSPSTQRRPPLLLERAMSSGGPVLVGQTPELWVPDFSRILSGNVSGVASPGTLVAAERLGAGNLMARSGVWFQSAVQDEGSTAADEVLGSGGRDPRDAWLALGFEDPAEFARYIAGRNLAEQELWIARLSARAEAQGLLGEFLEVLRGSGDATAAWVAEDFSAQAARARPRLSQAQDRLSR